MSANGFARRSTTTRWRTASDVLAEVRGQPGITRAALARRLGLSSGSATEVIARLRELRLLSETPAPPVGRGRPTAVLGAHPDGPVLLVVQLGRNEWHSDLVAVDGQHRHLGSGRHAGGDPAPVLDALSGQVRRARRSLGDRLRAVSMAISGIVAGSQLLDASTLGWPPLDLAELCRPAGTPDLPLLTGNDATLAGVAEARTGASRGARLGLHLLLEAGIGGTLTVDGRPLGGATGAAGEYGHLPFGDRGLRCPCGATGCWELGVGGAALARELGEPTPGRPRDYTASVLRRSATQTAPARAVASSAAELGVGIAGLVNAHDPDVVTLGGLAAPLRAAATEAFDTAYRAGLMSFRRPTPVLDATHGEHGARRGAAAVGLDHLTSESALAEWAAQLGS